MMIVIVGLFAIFFVTYAHSSFNKSRSKEFGLYLTLGMTNKDIGRLIKIENSIIIFLSLTAGLITGTIFSRLFFLIVVNLLNLEGIKFALSYKSYLLTILIFLFVFTLVIMMGRRMARKLEVARMLKGNKSNIELKKYNPFIGTSGIVLTVSSLIGFDLILKKQLFSDLPFLPLIMIGLSILGFYLTIAHLGSTLIFFSKRFRNKYFNNIININEVQNKFSQYKKILFIMTLLTIIVIYFIGMTYSSYSITSKFARNEFPYHLMYVVQQDDQKIVQKKFNDIVSNSNDIKVTEQKKLDYIEGRIYKTTNGKKGWFGSVEVISENGFNKISNQRLDIKSGEAVTLVKLTEPERNQWFNDKMIKMQMGEKVYEFEFKKELTQMLINQSKRTSRFMVIIDTGDYKELQKTVRSDKIGVFNLTNFSDWKNAAPVSQKLFAFMEDSLNYQQNDSKLVRYEVATRIEFFRAIKEQYGIFLFLMSFIGLLFFVSSGSVLYLKLFTDIDRIKIKYKKLFRIGISNKEIKRTISKELSLVFFAPLVLGSGLGLVFIMISTTNFALQGELILNTLVVAGIYGILQYIFYIIARQKYLNEIKGEIY